MEIRSTPTPLEALIERQKKADELADAVKGQGILLDSGNVIVGVDRHVATAPLVNRQPGLGDWITG